MNVSAEKNSYNRVARFMPPPTPSPPARLPAFPPHGKRTGVVI